MTSPVHLFPGVPVEGGVRARRSIHRSVQLVPWLGCLLLLRFQGSPVHVSTPFRAGHQARYPASYPPTIREEFPMLRPAVFCCLSAAGVRFLDTLSCQTGFAPIAVGLPPQARIPAHLPRTLAGFTRFPRVRPGPGRALSMPRGRRCSLAIGSSVAAACRLTSAGPYSPGTATQPGMCACRDIDESFLVVALYRPFPWRVTAHGWDGGPWAFP
jgi:hypothetical protein